MKFERHIAANHARMIRAMRGGLGAEDVSETDIASILCPAPAPCYGTGYYVSHLFQGR